MTCPFGKQERLMYIRDEDLATEITFDIVVSGCAAECWHCYVSGRPAPPMALPNYKDILAFIDEFSRIAGGQKVKVHPYLDLEPMNHPEIVEILNLTQTIEGFTLPSSIPTTGIPIARRHDWEQVLATYRDAGVQHLEFTLHGPEEIHDRALSRPGAFREHQQAVRRARRKAFETRLNLMVSQPMLGHFQETMEIVEENDYDVKRAAVPSYAPNKRLRAFERIRPGLPDLRPHQAFFIDFCDEDAQGQAYWKKLPESTEGKAYREMLSGETGIASYQDMIDNLPAWYFVTVGPGRDIWYGNGFHRTHNLGQIGKTAPDDLLEKILGLYPNYAFGGHFPLGLLPPPRKVAENVGDPNGQRVYHRKDEIHMMWLDKMLERTDDEKC